LSRTRPLALVLAVFALVAAAPASAASLATRLDRALSVSGVSRSATGALAIDLGSGRVVYGRNAVRPLRPASNEKLTVALAALDKLGPSFRVRTKVVSSGRLDRTVWRGHLVLKGFGDPALGRSDLARLADQLHARGIRRVTGTVIADESYFDARRTAPGWKASFYKRECPPLSALIVDEGKVGRVKVDNPALAAARAFRRALRAEGISTAAGARVGSAARPARALAEVFSPPLARLVTKMNRKSDNFVAEMLMKVLGAEARKRGTTAAGAIVVHNVLKERGVPLAGVRIADGSGLSLHDRLTARALAALLISAWSDPDVRLPFVRSLPVAGLTGTLEDRMERPPARGNVRAKTGTTREASALSGYVRSRYVFAILQNGNPIPWWHARRGQDRFAQILAGS
jgi:D-alanyl-D-alanine carboxypeptidase/D-alanyl-D-alanine-endopeptidase (penicillin-binding protein 4)